MRASRQDGCKHLYLNFDSYFAAVEEQAAPALHGRLVAVLPYPEAQTCRISSNAAAKRHGVGAGTGVDEARLREAVGPQVAKVASAMDKPDGLTVLDALPCRLLELDFNDLPGVGGRSLAGRASTRCRRYGRRGRRRCGRCGGACTGSDCGMRCTATT